MKVETTAAQGILVGTLTGAMLWLVMIYVATLL